MTPNEIFIVYNAPGVSELFHATLVQVALSGGKLPEELADLITFTPVTVDGKVRWIVDWAEYVPVCGDSEDGEGYDGPSDGEAWSGGFADNH